MKQFLLIVFCIIVLYCNDSNKKEFCNTSSLGSDANESTQLDLSTYSNYKEFLSEIGSIVCNKRDIIATHGESSSIAIRCINRCINNTFISCGSNLLSIYDKEFDSIQINIKKDEETIVARIKDYIENPLKMTYKAENEKKVGFHFRLNKSTSIEDVLLYLNKLNQCYQIARKETEAPDIIHLYFDNFCLLTPPPPKLIRYNLKLQLNCLHNPPDLPHWEEPNSWFSSKILNESLINTAIKN